jgi:CRISPR-associated endonuclease Csn1
VVDATFDNENKIKIYNGIEDVGVRIFQEGVVAKTIGTGDKEQSKNATRTEKRQIRRHFYRKRLRKIKLLQVLIAQGMCPLDFEELNKWKNKTTGTLSKERVFPTSEEFVNWIRLNPYELRDKALKENLTLFELGRVFYHMIQRRGFLSSRKGNDDPKTLFEKGKPEENILPINETKENIKDSSLGSYLNSVAYKDNQPYKTMRDHNGKELRLRGRYTTRDMYIAEFEKIWNVQSPYLKLEARTVDEIKVREFRGTKTAKRNTTRIEYLKQKYGEQNVTVGERGKGVFTVTTKKEVSLKKYLAGDIEVVADEDGIQYKFKSNESVLFWQRALRSQKGLLSNCRFENELPVIDKSGKFLLNQVGEVQKRSKKPCPISHPEFELFRAYQFINNIKYGKNPRLSDEEREKVLALMSNKDVNFDFVNIPKELKLTYEKFNYDDKLKVPANPTIKKLKPLFEPKVWEDKYEEIWHCFYFYEDNDKLFEKVKRDYGFKKDIEALKKIKLKDGYSNVSLKAIRNILPFLKNGCQFDRAVILGGVKNAFGKRWDYFTEYHHKIESEIHSILNEDNKDGEAIEKIKEHLSSPVFSYGFKEDDPHLTHLYHHSQELEVKDELYEYLPQVENLRNPIVQQGVNETRRLVNSLLRKYRKELGQNFNFERIHVEMGRELRNNKQQRQNMSNNIRNNEHKNDEARERLAEYGLKPSRDNVQKYLMFKEIEDRNGRAQCPYTGKTVSITDLLGTANAIQIEHIIPYSVSLDDSFANKTLCEAHFNNVKSEKTPYDFYIENPDVKLWGASSWEEIESRAFRLLPYAKAKRFTAKRKFEESTFIARQLNDSRYIAKKTVELLSHICKDVRVMPGQLTAELRHLWGLNNILFPIQELGKQTFDVDGNKSTPYYVVTDEKGRAVSLHKKFNERPSTKDTEILLPGYVSKNKYTTKYFNIDIEAPDLPDGKYWAKVEVNSSVQVVPKYIDKPDADEEHIIFKGRVEKGVFKDDTTGNLRNKVEDGLYWVNFEITNKNFESPVKDKTPKAKKNQILLYGNAYQGEFKCYIYQCKTTMPDGKYWMLIDYNPENIEFVKAINPKPELQEQEICIHATADDNGLMVADVDTSYQLNGSYPSGKYYMTLKVESIYSELDAIENAEPLVEKGQSIVEGNIWVDKYTGEIKFDPKKNRDDHRHHAIDAITIALTEQGFLQRLSTYNAQRKEKQREKLDSTEKFPEPWLGFWTDVKDKADSILISHKKDNKTLTKNKKGFSVRGQLHKENVFGKRKAPFEEKPSYHRRTKITDLQDNKHVNKVVDVTIRNLIT